MKKIITILMALMLVITISKAQTTAQDWTKMSCNGDSVHLFSVLDSQKCVILAYDMLPTCSLCIAAANLCEPIVNSKRLQHPDSVRFYCLGYTGTYSCPTMQGWETTNSYNHDALFTAGTDVSYYGGMGMPTIVVLGKNTHHVYWKKLGFATTDTTSFKNAIEAVFTGTAGVNEIANVSEFNLFPNPASSSVNIEFTAKVGGELLMEVVNLNGQLVQEIYNGSIGAGKFHNAMNTATIAEGMYFVKTTLNGVSGYEKLTVEK